MITISSINIAPTWQGNTANVALRIYLNSSFISASGNMWIATDMANMPDGPRPSLGTFFQSYNCTVGNTGVMTIPAISLDTTTDSIDNPDAVYSAVLFDLGSGKQIQQFGTFPSFTLSPTSGNNTTWANIFSQEADTY